MATSCNRSSIRQKGYKRNERIELYKGKSIVLSTFYNFAHYISLIKITKGLSTHIKLTGYSDYNPASLSPPVEKRTY